MTIGDYDVMRIIGDGSYANVYKVRHRRDSYICAIKELKQPIESAESPAYTKFMDECRTLFRLGAGGHPNILRMSNPQLINCKAVVEMDYIDGVSLHGYLEQHPFVPIDEVMRFTHQLVSAMAFCHRDIYRFMMDPREDSLERDLNDGSRFVITPDKERELIAKYRVIHNDLHSKNVMRRHYDGRYILLDFGLAIQNNDCVKSSSLRAGSPEYKSPEKTANRPITAASDVYSMGILLYEMLTGQVPFVYVQHADESEMAALVRVEQQHATEPVPDARQLRREAFEREFPGVEYRDDVPQQLLDIIYKCLQKVPEQRFADAGQVYDALLSFDDAARADRVVPADCAVARTPHEPNAELQAANRQLSQDLDAAKQRLTRVQQELTAARNQLAGNEERDREALELYRSVERLKSNVSALQSANATLTQEKESTLNALWQKDSQLKQTEQELHKTEATGGKLTLALICAVFVIAFLIYKLLQ